MSTITTKDGARIYDYPHGMATTQHDVIDADLLAFFKS